MLSLNSPVIPGGNAESVSPFVYPAHNVRPLAEDMAGFVIVYLAMAFSGAIVGLVIGLVIGWIIWG
jgi:hypothetical protein